MGQFALDALDHQILKMVAENARVPFLEVARVCGVSGAAIHQRVQKLTRAGVIRGTEYQFDPEKLGYGTCAFVGIYLKDPTSFDDVVEALKTIPQVVECHYTTGAYDLFVKIHARDNHGLMTLLHDKLQPLGLSRTETIISYNEVFSRQVPIE